MRRRAYSSYDTGTAAVFEAIDELAEFLAEHGHESALCAYAGLVASVTRSGNHDMACGARMDFLNHITNQLNSGATLEVPE